MNKKEIQIRLAYSARLANGKLTASVHGLQELTRAS